MTKVQKVTFWFDFSSPYAYIASTWIDDFAERHGIECQWKPYLLGAVFKEVGTQPLINYPMKGAYSKRDMARTARRENVSFQFPENFPFAGIAPGRTMLAVEAAHGHDAAKAFGRAALAAAWSEGANITDRGYCVALADGLGAPVGAGAITDEIKTAFKAVVDEGIAKEVFGTPFFHLDDEPFWGGDKRSEMSAWIETGGW